MVSLLQTGDRFVVVRFIARSKARSNITELNSENAFSLRPLEGESNRSCYIVATGGIILNRLAGIPFAFATCGKVSSDS